MGLHSRTIQRIMSDVIMEIEFFDELNERKSESRNTVSCVFDKFLSTRNDNEVKELDEKQVFDWLYKIGLRLDTYNINYVLSGAVELGYKDYLSKKTMRFKLPLAYKRLLIIQYKLRKAFKYNDVITLDSFTNQLVEANELVRLRNDFLFETQNWKEKYKRNIRESFKIDMDETVKWLNEARRMLGTE